MQQGATRRSLNDLQEPTKTKNKLPFISQNARFNRVTQKLNTFSLLKQVKKLFHTQYNNNREKTQKHVQVWLNIKRQTEISPL